MVEFGISVALLTPFQADGALDTHKLGSHARDMMDRGVAGVTLFGTTGEGASIGMSERATGIECLRTGGIDAGKTVLGVCGTAVEDVAAQVHQGLDAGIRAFLLPPPFYFADASDGGLFDWHAQLFAATDDAARFILYNIPQVTGVALSFALVSRLAERHGNRVCAIKDSSGDWDNARLLLDQAGIPVLVGDERLLHRAVALGAAGSICGMANLYPERMCRLFETGTEDLALSAEVDRIVSVPFVPALKALVARATGDAGWNRVRPPQSPLSAAARDTILADKMTVPRHG